MLASLQMKYDDSRQVWQVELVDIFVEVLGPRSLDRELKVCWKRVHPVAQFLNM